MQGSRHPVVLSYVYENSGRIGRPRNVGAKVGIQSCRAAAERHDILVGFWFRGRVT